MSAQSIYAWSAAAVGIGATLFMDLWAVFLNRAFGMPSANYCLVGRWLCHMPEGKFAHANIADASPRRYECAVGWIGHYLLGIAFAFLLVAFVSESWIETPTLLPALAFGIGSVVVPFFVMQPAFGLGNAASRTPNPAQARLRSLMAHAVFGVGLYLSAVAVSYVLPAHD
jgi:Protein of unknown function (DUF2938)